MAMPETRERPVTPAARMDNDIGLETIVSPYGAGLLIIGLAVTFLVVLIGFVTDRFAVLIAGSFALSAVTFIWAIAAAVGLWKSAQRWRANRRAGGNEAADAGLSQ